MKDSELLIDGFSPKRKDSVNVKEITLKYLKYWYLYLLGLVLSLSLAYGYLQFAVPEYPASSTILINAATANAPNKGSDFSQNAVYSELENYQSSTTNENEAEVLKSASLMKMALEELDLKVSYFIKDNAVRTKEIFGDQVPIKVIFHEYDSSAFFKQDVLSSFNIQIKDDKGFFVEGESETSSYHHFGEKLKYDIGIFSIEQTPSFTSPFSVTVNFNNPYALPGKYRSKLDVFIVNKMANVLKVSITDPVPEKGVMIINKLIEVYNKEAENNKNQKAKNTITFIDGQLQDIMVELDAIEQQVESYKRQNKITELSSDAQQYITYSNLSRDQLTEYTIQLEVLKSIENYLLEQTDDYEAVPSSLTIEDPTLLNLINQFNEMQKERDRMLRTTQPNNPLVLQFNQQLVSVRRNILENIKNIKSGLEIARKNLLARTSELDFKSEKVPEIERHLLVISRQQAIKQEHYSYLVKKKEEAALSLAATTVANSRVIDPAMAGYTPVKPNKVLILGFAFFVGLGMPFGLVYAREKFNDKITQKKDILSRTNVSILGEISHNDGKYPLAIKEKDRTPIAEQFRLLRTNLQFALPKHEKQVILVTSSSSGEGKTFFSLNLGMSLGLAGKKVAILEFDLRKPALLNYLGLEKEIGISDYLLSDDYILSDLIIKRDDMPEGLDFIGCGTLPDSPSELMLLPKVGYFLGLLKEKYDVLILDSAPVGQVADAFSLSKFADITAYIMRYNYTSLGMIEFLNENAREKKLINPTIILNDSKLRLSYGYDYYQKEVKKKKFIYKNAVQNV